MQYIFPFLVILMTGCQYLSPQFERAIEQEAVQDIQKIADANIPALTQAAAQPQAPVTKQ